MFTGLVWIQTDQINSKCKGVGGENGHAQPKEEVVVELNLLAIEAVVLNKVVHRWVNFALHVANVAIGGINHQQVLVFAFVHAAENHLSMDAG
ncbi:hypothetical protein TYRP_018603 [Tyrophagus putrescentiae]|nr:hypothetical protein TYRP_018603 [Tyrophagus putrescentiae]